LGEAAGKYLLDPAVVEIMLNPDGKLNFYCNVVDKELKHRDDHTTIGLILCQDKNEVVVEYALKGIDKPIGVSKYQLTKNLPKEFKSVLPSVEEIEAELAGDDKN